MSSFDLHLPKKLLWILLIPLIGLIFLAVHIINHEYQAAHLANNYQQFNNIAVGLSVLLGVVFATVIWGISRVTRAINTLYANLNSNQQLLDSYQFLAGELQQVFGKLSNGDLSQTVAGQYTGELLRLKTDVNDSVRKLNEAMSEIKQVIEIVNTRTLSQRVDLSGKQGFWAKI